MDDLIAQAKRFYEKIELPGLGELITVTEHWQKRVNAARGAIEMAQRVEDVIEYAQANKHSGFDHRVRAKELLIQQKHDEIKKRFPGFELATSGLAESPLSDPNSLMLLDGVSVSNIFFYHLEAYLSCIHKLCDRPKRVIEIGGGY